MILIAIGFTQWPLIVNDCLESSRHLMDCLMLSHLEELPLVNQNDYLKFFYLCEPFMSKGKSMSVFLSCFIAIDFDTFRFCNRTKVLCLWVELMLSLMLLTPLSTRNGNSFSSCWCTIACLCHFLDIHNLCIKEGYPGSHSHYHWR